MDAQTENGTWDKGFFRAVVISLKDSRFWLILLPTLVLVGVTLILFKPALVGLVSTGLVLVAGYLFSIFKGLPRPDESLLAESLYRNVLLPAATGIFVISSMGIFVELWAVQWHWFHGTSSTPPCSFLWIATILGLVGSLVAPALVALLTRERAVFATMLGLLVYFSIRLTDLLSGDPVSRVTSLLAKTCQMDVDDFSTDGFGIGIVIAVLMQALVAIFVAKVVATWLSRRAFASKNA